MNFWGVTSCPRPGMPRGYQPGFLESFRRDLPLEVLHTFHDEDLRGQAKNFLWMLEIGVDTGAPLLHTFEDDVRGAPGAFERVAVQAPPPWAQFVDWCALRIPMDAHGVGWRRAACSQFLGLQAVTFTRDAAIDILAAQRVDPWPEKHVGDIMVARALGGRYYVRHLPGIFDHVGAVSVCNPTKKLDAGRVSRTYVAELPPLMLPVFP